MTQALEGYRQTIRTLLPKEVYWRTKHLPYGEKSSESMEFSIHIANFLKNDCKMIVIAVILPLQLRMKSVKKQCPEIEIVNVIDPVIQRISKNKSIKQLVLELRHY